MITTGNMSYLSPGGGGGALTIGEPIGGAVVDNAVLFADPTGHLANAQFIQATANGSLYFNHLEGSMGAPPPPTIVPGTAAGAGATCTLSGDDMGGTISLVTGALTVASNIAFILTFGTPYSAAVRCVQLTPANANAANFFIIGSFFVPSPSATQFQLFISGALQNSSLYQFYYFVKR